MTVCRFAWFVPTILIASGARGLGQTDSARNRFVEALWYSHLTASPDTLTPKNDRALKAALTVALRDKAGGLSATSVSSEADRRVLKGVLGGRFQVTAEEMERAVKAGVPTSRTRLTAKVRQHADLLTTQFDRIDDRYHAAAGEFAGWIAKNYQPGKPLSVVVVCTGNSRRSILGASMGNAAAAYYGLTDLRFYSGGTQPSAFNPRTVAALKDIGFEIEAVGKEAARGSGAEPNPIYHVRWGTELETREFSKHYTDPQNPKDNFAAILVCDEADASCPTVRGASLRLPTPYQDPKVYDGAPFEAAKYAERRDDLGRFMLNVLMRSGRMFETGKTK